MAHLTHDQLAAVISAGGAVLFGGRVITRVQDLPTDNDLQVADTPVLVASAAAGSDTTAVHVGETTEGSATLTGDIAAATLHVGATTVPAVVPATVRATLALPQTESPDQANFPVYAGRYAVIVGGYGTHCSIVDLADPAAPATIATFSPHTGTAQFLCGCVSQVNGLLALTMLDSADPGAILEVWDISTPATPTYRASGTGPQADQLESVLPEMFGSLVVGAISSNYSTPAGVRVWSLSTLESPAQVGTLTLPATTSGAGGGQAAGAYATAMVARDAATILVGDHSGNLSIVSIDDDFTLPVVVGSLAVRSVRSVGALALLDTTHVLVRCSEDEGTVAYVVVDIATPASPTVLSTLESAASDLGTVPLAALSSLVYLANRTNGELLIFDTAQTPAPLVQTLSGVGALAALVAVSPTHLLGTTQDGGSVVVIEAATLLHYAALVESMSVGDLVAHGRPVLEGGAVATETITPDKTITVYAADGVAYKLPAVLA